eukprot:c8622_g1_i1 orf=1-240(-)
MRSHKKPLISKNPLKLIKIMKMLKIREKIEKKKNKTINNKKERRGGEIKQQQRQNKTKPKSFHKNSTHKSKINKQAKLSR